MITTTLATTAQTIVIIVRMHKPALNAHLNMFSISVQQTVLFALLPTSFLLLMEHATHALKQVAVNVMHLTLPIVKLVMLIII